LNPSSVSRDCDDISPSRGVSVAGKSSLKVIGEHRVDLIASSPVDRLLISRHSTFSLIRLRSVCTFGSPRSHSDRSPRSVDFRLAWLRHWICRWRVRQFSSFRRGFCCLCVSLGLGFGLGPILHFRPGEPTQSDNRSEKDFLKLPIVPPLFGVQPRGQRCLGRYEGAVKCGPISLQLPVTGAQTSFQGARKEGECPILSEEVVPPC